MLKRSLMGLTEDVIASPLSCDWSCQGASRLSLRYRYVDRNRLEEASGRRMVCSFSFGPPVGAGRKENDSRHGGV